MEGNTAIWMPENGPVRELLFPSVTASQENLTNGNQVNQGPPSTGDQSCSQQTAVESGKGNAPRKPTEPLATLDGPVAVPSIEPTREARLEAAFLLLQAEGQRISGTALANRAGVRKQAALAWLQQQAMHSS
jgi:hypothetical protein